MLLGRLFGNEEKKQQPNRFSIGRIKGHRLRQSDQCGNRLFQAFDPAVGDGDALAQAGGSQPFSGKQRIEYFYSRNALIVLKEKPRLLKDALFTAGFLANGNVGQG